MLYLTNYNDTIMKGFFFIILSIFTISFYSCKTVPKQTVYSTEETQIFDYLEKIRKNDDVDQFANDFSTLYQKKIIEYQEDNFLPPTLSLGDKYLQKAERLKIPLSWYKNIISNESALKIISTPWDPSQLISECQNNAAQQFYNQGLEYLNYNNRTYALKALAEFNKVEKVRPGFKDVKQKITEAQRLSIYNIIVNPVNYYNNTYNYWGFQNDYLQDKMVRDLNFASFKNARFFTDWEATSRRIQVDKVVDLNMVTFYMGPVSTETKSYQRSAQIQVGNTQSIPSKPVYQSVTATITITTRIMRSNAALECRIYDRSNASNIFLDRFPGNYTWQNQTAKFIGDKRALNQEDLRILNNSQFNSYPTRNEVAEKLINDCYFLLLSRIKTAVQF